MILPEEDIDSKIWYFFWGGVGMRVSYTCYQPIATCATL